MLTHNHICPACDIGYTCESLDCKEVKEALCGPCSGDHNPDQLRQATLDSLKRAKDLTINLLTSTTFTCIKCGEAATETLPHEVESEDRVMAYICNDCVEEAKEKVEGEQDCLEEWFNSRENDD